MDLGEIIQLVAQHYTAELSHLSNRTSGKSNVHVTIRKRGDLPDFKRSPTETGPNVE